MYYGLNVLRVTRHNCKILSPKTGRISHDPVVETKMEMHFVHLHIIRKLHTKYGRIVCITV